MRLLIAAVTGLRVIVGATLCIIVGATQGWAQQPAAIQVGTVAAERRPITQAIEFVGRVEAMERVDIRARVTGFLQEVLFKEGAVVKEGRVLYRIERESFDAAGRWCTRPAEGW
jgi:membrane fusion protein (multidrug efflux system)